LATLSQIPFLLNFGTGGYGKAPCGSESEGRRLFQISKRLKQVNFNRAFRYLKGPDGGWLIGQREARRHLRHPLINRGFVYLVRYFEAISLLKRCTVLKELKR
jgi:hypothetical protein